MADSVIGALRVVLGLDSAGLDHGLKESQSSFAKFGKDMATIAGGIGLEKIIEKAFDALSHAVKQGVQQADQFGKAAQKFGIPVEQLSALSLAAAVSDVSMDTLGKSLAKLSKTMVESAAKPTSEAANAFRALGISATDSSGKIKPTETVLQDIAGKFEGLKDGAGKTAVAMALFGRSGAELIPLLNSGSHGLKEMTDEAAQLGLVISKETSKSAEAFNDNLTRLSKVKDGIILQVTARMLPAFQSLSQVLIDAAKNSTLMENSARVLTITMQGLVTGGIIVGTVFAALGSIIGGVSSALAFFAKGEFTAAWEALKTGGTDIASTAVAAATAIKGIWAAGAGAQIATEGIKGASTALKDFNFSALAGKNALDQFLASQIKHTAAIQADVLTTGLAAGAKEKLRIQLQANTVASEAHISVNEKLKSKIDQVATAAGEMALKLKGAQLVESAEEPGQKFRQEMDNNQKALTAFGATSEQIAQVHQKAALAIGATWEQQSANLAGSFAAVATAFGKNNKDMAIAAKAFGIVQAIINTYIAYTKALASLPPPFNIAAAAVALASGLAAVATIAATPIPAKHGADFIVPGGIGGGDRVPFNAMLEPGEHVQITPNGARPSSGVGGSSGDRVITVRFEGDDLGIGQKVARRIVTALNEVMRDGARLKVA